MATRYLRGWFRADRGEAEELMGTAIGGWSVGGASSGDVGRFGHAGLRATAMAAALALALAGCASDEPSAEAQTDAMPNDAAMTPAYSAFAGVVSTAGDVEVNKKADVAVGEVKVSAGDVVHAGDVLFTYDVESAGLDLEKAQLELAQMESELSMTRANKEALEKEKAKAEESLQLSYSLEIQEKETAIMEQEYRIQTKQREIEQLEALVADADVVSPVDGTVRSVSDGSSDSSGAYGYDGSSGASGSGSDAFIVISKTTDILVMGSVDEANLAEVYEGMEVAVRARAGSGEWSGTVTSIETDKPLQQNSYYYDPSQSSKYPFYVALDSTEGLVVGQHVYIVAEWGASGMMGGAPGVDGMGGMEGLGDLGGSVDSEIGAVDGEGFADATDDSLPASSEGSVRALDTDALSSAGPGPAASATINVR